MPSTNMALSWAKACASRLSPPSPRLLAILLLAYVTVTTSPTLVNAQRSTCNLSLTEYEIRYRDCAPKTVLALACAGGCHSYSRPDPNNPDQLERSCQCCREMGRQRARIRLRCPSYDDPRISMYFVVRVSLPRSCTCRPCNV
ncbi:hypothetical protein BaRGS_00036204 [Batillaria attramentaria]|uniref:Bursicon n=1 Tax=Batillaria attramentaria TaxID=370345 RepID=A0ABD0JDQ1_9CAEN|nr:hypothetical protein BaRGS_033812 [Batillaria attramentaria]